LVPRGGISQKKQKNIYDYSLEELLNIEICTAAKCEQRIMEAPSSVTIITSEDIERYGYQTLEDVLKSIGGFYVSNDRNYGYVGVRGFSRPTDYNNRILLLLNGHTLNDRVYGSAFIDATVGIDLSHIERIEIVRGPGSALYGTSAMFAVMNIITKPGADVDGLKLSIETGSYGRIQGGLAFGSV